ncbi:FAD-dependent oxidoreductase [Runella slithyformis]|uniref:Fumarate reductase/succinate dehydrogenase flavoprotein domain protein n=1 Tax=Runella slithyformis (strain ATCC 29530 / DSM 19594 / LMG 11500 / NCIMB 11436 / LSU 4) TaxID=761193 RepID=A0A7U3ZKW8_RUNSL|nr:FAD-dependent oxidoreductase [Runella slithyformis]AEI49042.1 fumarate reductase/succinate dehydrogenase flavoprotein domain protein [Runella slithyformis DSM 19594]
MIKAEATAKRAPKSVVYNTDLVVVGGGLSGVCGAITAARAGIKVALVTDRPVLGGNASSEVRLWVLGATSHMGNNNRWAREGGVIDELLVENMYRNPDSNPLIFDTILLEKTISEPNITLLLNTSVYDLEKSSPDTIAKLYAFCSQNSTQYELVAPLFCDASGDGIVGFLAGAAFRMGAESREEFGEKFAPSKEYGELLGHSLYFYSKDAGKPITYVPPGFAHDVTQKVPKFRSFNTQEFGCKLWWIEYGGRLDTVHETEAIKWELWKVVYGVWNYIKNSGRFPEAENLTLEWVGHIPGKRESRRFEGDYMLIQQDIVEQRTHFDDVAFGGWSIDLHPSDGVFSEIGQSSCNQWHSKGIYGIPYRCFYSKNINNLFMAGRIISASHVAFGSSRVMATSAHGGQAVGMAAKMCIEKGLLPRQLSEPQHIAFLQQELLKTGQHIPNVILEDSQDLVQKATISASSELVLEELLPAGEPQRLEFSVAQMLPVCSSGCTILTKKEGDLQSPKIIKTILHPYADEPTELEIELRISSRADNHTPDVILEKRTIALQKGRNCVHLEFDLMDALKDYPDLESVGYAFLVLQKNEKVKIQYSDQRITGILSVFNTINEAVSNYGKQEPTEDIGVDTFEFWCPQRRPLGKNLALKVEPALPAFQAGNVRNGLQRPTRQPNAWVAAYEDKNPFLLLKWAEKQRISEIVLHFDTDFDHPMETVLMAHPENEMPFCVKNVRILNDKKEVIAEIKNNHQSQRRIVLAQPVDTQSLTLQIEHPSALVPAALLEVRCY